MTPKPYLIFLKSKKTNRFEYEGNLKDAIRNENSWSITFANEKTFTYGNDKVRHCPLIATRSNIAIYFKGSLSYKYNIVDDYGAYWIFRSDVNKEGEEVMSRPIVPSDDIEICDLKQNTTQTESLLDYYSDIISQNGTISFDAKTEEQTEENKSNIGNEILFKAISNVNIAEQRSVLSDYSDRKAPKQLEHSAPVIFPFGCNGSQMKAVEMALNNSISIVEGPPGTGKTQTILSIIANLLSQGKSVAIVSNNNSAVDGVSSKLTKNGYGSLIASLGNNANKSAFFSQKKAKPLDVWAEQRTLEKELAETEIEVLNKTLADTFIKKNSVATLKSQLADAEIECLHLKKDQPMQEELMNTLNSKFIIGLNHKRALGLKKLLLQNDKMTFRVKAKLLLQYGYWDVKNIGDHIDALPLYVNHKFYEQYIKHIKAEIDSTEEWLSQNNEKENLERLTSLSKNLFDAKLFDIQSSLEHKAFEADSYKKEFGDFVKHYPVTTSTTMSLHNSIPNGFLFDYVIIDESSQVDIIKASICFSCARNVVIVGDSMQLSHIVDQNSVEINNELMRKHSIGKEYSYVDKNILDSLKALYGDKIQSTLLKEHYRCEPSIISFCSKKYYNNELVVMSSSNESPFLVIETNISGYRDYYNQRQIDETKHYIESNHTAEDYGSIGVISPYRKHANMLKEALPESVLADTIHKYQGDEKGVIIFNVVTDKLNTFVDNSSLINVAVSRAVDKFVIIKPKSMELPHGTNLGDLIKYITYISDPAECVVDGEVNSVFDMLYKEYNNDFAKFLANHEHIFGSPAEKLMFPLLAKILGQTEFSTIDVVREYPLRDLVKNTESHLEEDIQFIRNNSRIDFLLYSKIDRSPILAIEVDGVSFHNNKTQVERDKKKDRILDKLGLPMLRLSTNGSDEERIITNELVRAMAGEKTDVAIN